MTPFDSSGSDDGRKNSYAEYIPPFNTATWITLAAGVILGFTVGLIIAWGIFPVEWTNAWPGDLTQEARAQYLAAVAESYVYYGDEQAAEIARNRLFDLNDNLAEEIAAAQAYFMDNPQRNSRVYVSNLGQLAQALDVQSPDIIVDTPGAGESAAVVPAPGESSVGDTVRAWVNWTLTLLAALLLVGGGIYIIGRLNQRRSGERVDYVEDDEPGGFDEEPRYATTPAGRNPFMRPSGQTRPRPSSTAAGAGRAAAVAEPAPHDEYGFDDEDDEDTVYSRGRTLTEDAPAGGFVAGADDDYRDEDMDHDAPPEGEPHFVADFDEHAQPQFSRVADTYDEEDLYDDEDEVDEDEEIIDEPLMPTMASTRAASRPPAEMPALYTFTVQYQAGMLDYDQSYSILNPDGGRYIGDCGMGINMKNGVLQNNPESVIALDVWLVDKKQEKSYSSQTRVLISEYVVDHNLDNAFTRERPNDPSPFVPHPGTKFQLRGPSLVLDCEVIEADYIKSGQNAGIFQNLKLEMTVRSRD